MIDSTDVAVVLVLVAAVLHALWNTLLKIKAERAITVMLITAGAALGGAVMASVLPMPGSAAWPYIALSTCIHCGYFWSLSAAYRHCGLSVAYPIARGGAPILVMLLSVGLLDEHLDFYQVVGVILLTAGVLSLAITPLLHTRTWQGPAWAMLTACFIAAYSIVDGQGARQASNPHSYTAWLFVAQFFPVTLFVAWRYRAKLLGELRAHARPGLVAGLLSLFSYWIVIWAMTVISVPVAAALRETSVFFAMIIGVVWLKEPWSLRYWAATCLVLAGLGLLRL
ncbi:MAG: DMT family transporter [Granulosicoccaceae bacterium]